MSHFRLRLIAASAALIALVGVGNAFAAGNVVISQVYGGGGNSGATYKQDYVELLNRSGAPQSLSGWSIQYGSSGSTGNNLGDASNTITPLPRR
ncbi:MAG TPA: lamin tail domain-containing protein [Gaiellaceae bacterium]|nr:lamin tail domain-containing protein [Gaiellaceae bacterium]